MKSHIDLMLANKAWVQDKLQVRPDYFEKMAATQQPQFLWIGCSDSRVPAEDVTGAEPGELFVHRNIANLVVHTDFNMLSVLQFAVDILKVEHVIVCGHYGCGGVKTAMGNENLGLINKWLINIKDVHRAHNDELKAITDENDRYKRLVELNVIEQVRNLSETSTIQKAWKTRSGPIIHGWVYELKTGFLKDLVMLDHTCVIDEIYRYDFN